MEILKNIITSKYTHCLIAAAVALFLDKVVVTQFVKHLGKGIVRIDESLKSKYKTQSGVIRTLISVIIYFFAFLYLLHVLFNVNSSSVIAATGIVGIAASLGAQSVIKDAISGFFVLIENQYEIGDLVTVDSFMGTVEKISIRTTVIKNFEGDRLIIPNGNMSKIINHSKTNKSIIVSVSVSYQQDTAKVLSLVEQSITELYETSSDMLEPPKLLGVSELNDFAVRISLIAYCESDMQFAVRREILKAIKLDFDKNNIIMPGMEG